MSSTNISKPTETELDEPDLACADGLTEFRKAWKDSDYDRAKHIAMALASLCIRQHDREGGSDE